MRGECGRREGEDGGKGQRGEGEGGEIYPKLLVGCCLLLLVSNGVRKLVYLNAIFPNLIDNLDNR